jgi:hypothetical protein
MRAFQKLTAPRFSTGNATRCLPSASQPNGCMKIAPPDAVTIAPVLTHA